VIENDQIYADASFPTHQWRVSGVKLEPFSIGHAIILQSHNSPFLDFRSPEFEDLMLALWICSRPVEPNRNPARDSLPRRWRWAARLLRGIAKDDPERTWVSIQMLQEYIFDSLWFKPPISTKNDKICRTSSCPTMIPMLRALQNHWRYTEREALNMPLKKAKMLHAAWLEHEGALQFVTQADKDTIEQMKKPENVAWNKRIREEAARKVAANKK
jgi:hypothetical protein